MQLGLGLNIPLAPQYGGTVGAGTGAENFLLNEDQTPLLLETGAELLLE